MRCASAESGAKAQRRFGSDLPANRARRGRIEVEKIEQIVRAGGVTIGEDETGIAHGRLVKQPDRF